MTTNEVEMSQIKLIAVGDSGVGKTSILTRFNDQQFNNAPQPTLGVAFLSKKHTLMNGKVVQFHIWDTAGQEKYRSIAPIYYREAKIALCVYDITSMRSFQIMKKWVQQLQANGPKDMVLAVVGNKIDRCDEEQVDYAIVKQYASNLGATFKLVSAKQGKNIKDLFTNLGQQIVKKMQQQPPLTKIPVGSKIKSQKQSKGKSCC